MLLFLLLLSPVSSFADSQAVFLAGAAEVEITPQVKDYVDRNGNGKFDFGDPGQPFGFGDRVISFVDGNMLVGNGKGSALYVYDRLYASALVLEDPKTHTRVALVNSDVYLLTEPDVRKIRSLVDPKYRLDHIVIASTHNHMGPDTLGTSGLGEMELPKIINAILVTGKVDSGINESWFQKYTDSLVDCIEEAARTLRPADITFTSTKFHMGLNDWREPLIMDTSLNVMAVDEPDGTPIATLVQWANHPETVLLYGSYKDEDINHPFENLTPEQKEAWGRVFTAGFPGYFRETIRSIRGGVPMYFNGAVGGMQTPLKARLWDPEKHPKYPATENPEKVPDEILIPNDFRFAPILGRELAKAAVAALDQNGEKAVFSDIRFAKEELLVPLENHFFRVAASLGILGHDKGILYDNDGNPDSNFGTWVGGFPFPGIQAYTGKNVKAEVSVINIGPAQIINIPAEPLPESIIGFPDDFVTNADRYFPKNKKSHAHGKDYSLAVDPLKSAATGKYLFTFGLSGGELGYIVPESDFDPPHDLKIPPFAWSWWICFDAEKHPHYEESMAISSQLESIIMGSLYRLLEENPIKYYDAGSSSQQSNQTE